MKTLLITFDYPPLVGGIATVFDRLWRRVGDGDSLILAPNGHGAREFDRAYPIRTVRFPALPGKSLPEKMITTLSGLIWFVCYAIRLRPDVVIAGQVLRAGPMAHAWSVLTGRPFYLWIYGGETSPGLSSLRWTARYARRVIRSARMLFTNSSFTTALLRDFGIADEHLVEVTLGANEDLSPQPKDPAYVERLGLADKLVFLTIGRLIERKGVDTMLDALAAEDGELPAWHYLVVSDGPHRKALQEQVRRLGLDAKVTFSGYIDDHELLIYYNLCDVFAMPNREVRESGIYSMSVEGFGMVFIDAAACGKPVIAGRSGGAVDAVADGVNGFLVDPTKVEDVRRAIRALADPELRDRMGRAGIEFSSRFTWSRSAAILRPYLERVP